MFRLSMIRTFAALAAFASLTACFGGSTSPKSGTLTLLLTDAPGDFKKAVVTIDQIYLQPTEGSDVGRVILRDVPVTTDLLTLANATAELVKDAVVPGGSYTQLRFIISGAYIEVENANGSTSVFASSPSYAGLPPGTTVNGSLQMPSFAQTGIKVNLPGGAVEISGEQQVLLVDFDVSRSFGQQAGASGMWVMTPVLDAIDFAASATLNVTLRQGDGVTMPSIEGTPVTLAAFSAVLSNAAGSNQAVELTDADGDGVFVASFRFLIPGDFTIDFKAPESVTFTTDPARPAAVTVSSGQSLTRAFVLTSAGSQ